MPNASSRARQPANGHPDFVSNQSLADPQPDHLRSLVLNYLSHNCYLKTAEAFAKDSAVRHLDGDVINDRPSAGLGTENGLDTIGTHGSSTDLSDEMVRHIYLRQRIQLEILSGNVKAATDLLNRHFPKILQETDGGENEMEVTDENASPSKLEYIAETVNPVHLSLNLLILAFIEACRTVPLVYTPPRRAVGSSISPDSDVDMVVASPKLYAIVSALRNADDRTIYLKELSNVGGLLAYKVPEDSPMAKYLHQERRNRVAEQINSAILYHSNMPSVSYLERAVRYTHCLWAMLHELRVKVPVAQRPRGVSLPGPGPQGVGESEKEASHEARPFDLQLLLNTRT